MGILFNIIDSISQSYRTALCCLWTLPRTKKVSTGHFLTLPTAGPSFRVPSHEVRNKREDTLMGILSFIWYAGRDSNPQPSEPESDALSIEPPAHLYSQAIIATFPPFVKRAAEKLFFRFPLSSEK